MSYPGIFRPPFQLPRPTQPKHIATLTSSAAVAASFPPWKASALHLIYSLFQPAFIKPKVSVGIFAGMASAPAVAILPWIRRRRR